MDTKHGALDKNKMGDMFAFMLESLCIYSQSMGRKTSRVVRNFAENFHLADLLDEISDKLGEHPFLRFLALAAALTFTMPVAIFVAFGLLSVVVTFSGFLVIEGMLLAVGGLCMITCLFSMVMFSAVLAVVLGVSYFISIKFMILFKNYQSSSSFLRHLRPTLMNNGEQDISSSIDDVHRD